MSQTVQAKKYIDKKVLIKEVGSYHDKVFVVKGLPQELLFAEDDKILPGIEISQTGDGSFVFNNNGPAKLQLSLIDQYIRGVYPSHLPAPKRIHNAQEPGRSATPALSESQLEEKFKEQFRVPFIDLPIPEDNVISHPARSVNEMTAESFKKDGFLEAKKEFVEAEVVPSKLQCSQCDYSGQNIRALTMHINVKHRKKENGLADDKGEGS